MNAQLSQQRGPHRRNPFSLLALGLLWWKFCNWREGILGNRQVRISKGVKRIVFSKKSTLELLGVPAWEHSTASAGSPNALSAKPTPKSAPCMGCQVPLRDQASIDREHSQEIRSWAIVTPYWKQEMHFRFQDRHKFSVKGWKKYFIKLKTAVQYQISKCKLKKGRKMKFPSRNC